MSNQDLLARSLAAVNQLVQSIPSTGLPTTYLYDTLGRRIATPDGDRDVVILFRCCEPVVLVDGERDAAKSYGVGLRALGESNTER